MPYRLKNGVYGVRCRHHHCPFNARVEIDQEIRGLSEADVESEARKIAREVAQTRHDSASGSSHMLENPEIRKVSGSYQSLGAARGPVVQEDAPEVTYKEFRKGDIILREGDEATTLCEVLQGTAFPEHNRAHRYEPGGCFGAAALLANHSRMTNIISGSDTTRIAFYNFNELSRRDPRKARLLFAQVLEDTFQVIRQLERAAAR